MTETNTQQVQGLNVINVVWMPTNPPRPAPPLLTEAELITFLRLDTMNITEPRKTLAYWREKKILKAVPVSRRGFVYRLVDAVKFADDLVTRRDDPMLRAPKVRKRRRAL